jgi:hypothetical protein
MTATYDEIGREYREWRRADPRLAGAIWAALGGARSVINERYGHLRHTAALDVGLRLVRAEESAAARPLSRASR